MPDFITNLLVWFCIYMWKLESPPCSIIGSNQPKKARSQSNAAKHCLQIVMLVIAQQFSEVCAGRGLCLWLPSSLSTSLYCLGHRSSIYLLWPSFFRENHKEWTGCPIVAEDVIHNWYSSSPSSTICSNSPHSPQSPKQVLMVALVIQQTPLSLR
jgi:hypothetical protein